jgi:hypothetical protein
VAPERFGPYIERLKKVYAEMDRSYRNTADRYRFKCSGCEDSCCLTLFHHHTFVEFFYLAVGFRSLKRPRQTLIRQKARAVCGAAQTGAPNRLSARYMCPLNFGNRCCLYAYRPMICRLHGIPSQLHRPGDAPVRSPGCAEFEKRCGQKAYIAFDRTGFYRDLARIEHDLRGQMPAAGKIKLTVAEMILAF